MKDNFWFCCWMICFTIIYCAALAWPFVLMFIWEIEEDLKKLFKKNN